METEEQNPDWERDGGNLQVPRDKKYANHLQYRDAHSNKYITKKKSKKIPS